MPRQEARPPLVPPAKSGDDPQTTAEPGVRTFQFTLAGSTGKRGIMAGAISTEPHVQQGRWLESKRPVGLGLMMPIAEQNAVEADSPREGFRDFLAMAKMAQQIGYDMIWVPDHFILKLDWHGGEAWMASNPSSGNVRASAWWNSSPQ